MLVYVLYYDENFLVHPKDPIWLHYQSFKWWLLPHSLGGACAILLGSLQFSEQGRQRYQKLHRALGRIYVFDVFVAAQLGVYIQCFEERPPITRASRKTRATAKLRVIHCRCG